MLIEIQVDEANVVRVTRGDGGKTRVLVRVPRDELVAWCVTARGEAAGDFDGEDNPAIQGGYLLVSRGRGSIRYEKHV